MNLYNFLYDGLVLALFGEIDDVVVILPGKRPVGGNFHNIEVVNILKLGFLGFGGARHTGKLRIHTEIVLEGDGGERFVFALYLNALLRLESLMEPIAVAPAEHQAAGELIHDEHFAVLHHIILVARKERVRLHGLQNVVI